MKEYIEREAILKYTKAMYELAKKHAESMMAGSEFWRGWYNMLVTERKSVVEFLENLPAADVAEVRHGRWEMVPYNGVYDMRCSVCGFCPGIRFYSSDYCPNCGARMDKEDEHEAD